MSKRPAPGHPEKQIIGPENDPADPQAVDEHWPESPSFDPEMQKSRERALQDEQVARDRQRKGRDS